MSQACSLHISSYVTSHHIRIHALTLSLLLTYALTLSFSHSLTHTHTHPLAPSLLSNFVPLSKRSIALIFCSIWINPLNNHMFTSLFFIDWYTYIVKYGPITPHPDFLLFWFYFESLFLLYFLSSCLPACLPVCLSVCLSSYVPSFILFSFPILYNHSLTPLFLLHDRDGTLIWPATTNSLTYTSRRKSCWVRRKQRPIVLHLSLILFNMSSLRLPMKKSQPPLPSPSSCLPLPQSLPLLLLLLMF